jgi:hypothetical protein
MGPILNKTVRVPYIAIPRQRNVLKSTRAHNSTARVSQLLRQRGRTYIDRIMLQYTTDSSQNEKPTIATVYLIDSLHSYIQYLVPYRLIKAPYQKRRLLFCAPCWCWSLYYRYCRLSAMLLCFCRTERATMRSCLSIWSVCSSYCNVWENESCIVLCTSDDWYFYPSLYCNVDLVSSFGYGHYEYRSSRSQSENVRASHFYSRLIIYK